MTEADRRRDPRAEPEDDDDTGPHYVETPFAREEAASTPPSTSQVRSVGTPIGAIRRISEGERAAPAEEDRPTASCGVDLAAVEHLLDQGQWQALVDLLGPEERVTTLPPHLALVFALAHAETHPEGAGHDVQLAIDAAARVCSVPATSPIARVVAKRLLRRGPTNWHKRPAPPKKISVVLVLLALLFGGGGGFWLSTTKVRIPLPGILTR